MGGVRTSYENCTPAYTAPGIVAQCDAQICRYKGERVEVWTRSIVRPGPYVYVHHDANVQYRATMSLHVASSTVPHAKRWTPYYNCSTIYFP